jgi:hypothetical protein
VRVASIALRAAGSKYQVLDTSILDTRGERSEPIPARAKPDAHLWCFARGIVAEPPKGVNDAPEVRKNARR